MNNRYGPTVGILAGMGPRSTAPFVDLVIDQCQLQYGARHDIDFPRLLICSQPAPFYEDRPTDHAALEAAIRDGLEFLESAGADFLAIACNTAHIYYGALAAAVGVKLLNIVELGADAVPDHARRIALVAARPTMESEIFQRRLDECGFEFVAIDWQDEVDAMLAATRQTTEAAVFKAHWGRLFERAVAEGADAVLLACLDLSGVVRHAPDSLPVVDAAEALAAEIVREWLARRAL